MSKMTAAEAAVHVLRKEGVSAAFGVPGAAINPSTHSGLVRALERLASFEIGQQA